MPSVYANSVHAMRMCDAFARAGHRVSLYTAPGSFAVEDPHAYYGVRHRFRIRTVSSPDYTPAGYRVRAERVRRLLVRDAPDLIYGHDLYALTVGVGIAPLVYETHRMRDDPNTLRIEHDLLHADVLARIVVITGALEHEYRRVYGASARLPIVVAPEGADPPDGCGGAAGRPELPGRPDARRIGYVGHLYEGRGIDLVLDLARRLPDLDFHLVGGTPEDLAHWTRPRHHVANAYFHGHRPPATVGAYYPLFDVVLAPYQARVYTADGHCETGRWASPMKMFEYMAHGRALVASDLPVLREVLDDRVNCLLRPPTDAAAWAQAITELLADEPLRTALGERARRQVLHRHTWRHRVDRVLAHLDVPSTSAGESVRRPSPP
ncbi:glycosyltransferase family 4 protein [Embleya sp. NPDC008237]|uniref:glycosyltransferase family 4 protein n=1 Tax=Embleya sp. NPDC008237 TaxID=3363978 RepID=UPI0036E56148